MFKDNILKILDKSKEFGEIAERVNTSSRLRKEHSEKALSLIDELKVSGKKLNSNFKKIADSDTNHMYKDSMVFNEIKKLKYNIISQKELISEIKNDKDVKSDCLAEIENAVLSLEESLDEALSNLQAIMEKNYQICMLDEEILMNRSIQQEYINILKKNTNISLDNANKAIEGSKSNLERGLNLVNECNNVEKYLSEKNLERLNDLFVEANRGWNLAVDVNKNSIIQLEFAEEVYNYTKHLNKKANDIKNLVKEKHDIFETSLQIFTVLTIIITVKFKKYLKIINEISKLDDLCLTNSNCEQLKILIRIVSDNLMKLISQNYDMTETSHIINENETKAVELTDEEIVIFEKIKEAIEFMTEATRFPIEGSNKNITNGQSIEKYVKEIIDSL